MQYRLRLITAAFLIGCTPAAFATSFVMTTDAIASGLSSTSKGTSKVSSSSKDDKIILEARDDAASFVASQGQIRGARLEAALIHIRSQMPTLDASDQQLAEAILSL